MHVCAFVISTVDCVVCAIAAFNNVLCIYLFSYKAASVFLINLLTYLLAGRDHRFLRCASIQGRRAAVVNRIRVLLK